MRFRTWPVEALGRVGLLVLVALTSLIASRRAHQIYEQLDQQSVYHRNVDAKLRRLRSDVNFSGIYVRDYLLDTLAFAAWRTGIRELHGQFSVRRAGASGTIVSVRLPAALPDLTTARDRVANVVD